MRVFSVFLILLIVGCGGPAETNMSEAEIDAYVNELRDTSQTFELERSLVYSRDDESYRVDAYYVQDTLLFYVANEMSEDHTEMIYYYLKDQDALKIEAYRMDYRDSTTIISERKIYLNNGKVLASYERSSPFDTDIETLEFREIEEDTLAYNVRRAQRAMEQAGEFAMQFGDFLVINPDAYLVLENEESEYGVALYIKEGDMLLDELYENPQKYKGKVINVQHEFETMNGIERMIYRGGILMEKEA